MEGGERLRVTISGRPVAELVPLAQRPSFVPWDELMRDIEHWRADAGLATDLAKLLPETTEDLPIQ